MGRLGTIYGVGWVGWELYIEWGSIHGVGWVDLDLYME